MLALSLRAENGRPFGFSLSDEEMRAIDALKERTADELARGGRLCWRTDPLRLLDFD